MHAHRYTRDYPGRTRSAGYVILLLCSKAAHNGGVYGYFLSLFLHRKCAESEFETTAKQHEECEEEAVRAYGRAVRACR